MAPVGNLAIVQSAVPDLFWYAQEKKDLGLLGGMVAWV